MEYPRLRENVWHVQPDAAESFLITTDGSFQVPTDEVLTFLRVRSHCTGFNSLDEIAAKSAVPLEKIKSILTALQEIDLVIPPDQAGAPPPSVDLARDKAIKICKIWAEELKQSYIANQLAGSALPKTVLVGWLIEMYHYIKDFSYAIEHGARVATGPLRTLLERYAREERGHEEFVTSTLTNIGLSRAEVERSSPLPSTRLIGFIMREMFALEPASTLMMAALVESQEFDAGGVADFEKVLEEQYQLPAGAMAPYFKHQQIDTDLGHSRLLEDNIQLFSVTDPEKLDAIVNKLHDLKHSFDLQGTEIKSYYNDMQGRYLPRQPIGFHAL